MPLPSERPASILIRGVNWLGDAVMSTPALLRLKEAFPAARNTILTPAKLAELWRHHPAIDFVVSFADQESAWTIARRLRDVSFDLALILPNSFRSALEIWLTRVPQRVGYRGQWRTRLLTQAVSRRPTAFPMRKRSPQEIRTLLGESRGTNHQEHRNASHQIHEYLHLASSIGAKPDPLPPCVQVTDGESRDFLDRWQLGPPTSRTLIGLNPGAEYGPAKRWPPEHFVTAALEIQKQTDCQWLIFGGQADEALAAEIQARMEAASRPRSPLANPKSKIQNPKSNTPPIHNLAGRTSLRELCAGLKACRALLTNDTGPMHIAAAVGTPVVALFGSTSSQLTGPGLPGDATHRILSADVPCSPCFLRQCPVDFRCMKRIDVEQVIRAVIERVRSQSTTSTPLVS